MDDYDEAEAMRERRSAVLNEAWANIARVNSMKVERREYRGEWQRPAPAPVPERKLTDAEALRISKQWQGYISDQIAAALVEERRVWREVHGRVIAHERQLHRAEIAKLKADIDLRLPALAEKLERGIDRAPTVIDLPSLGRRDGRA